MILRLEKKQEVAGIAGGELPAFRLGPHPEDVAGHKQRFPELITFQGIGLWLNISKLGGLVGRSEGAGF